MKVLIHYGRAYGKCWQTVNLVQQSKKQTLTTKVLLSSKKKYTLSERKMLVHPWHGHIWCVDESKTDKLIAQLHVGIYRISCRYI